MQGVTRERHAEQDTASKSAVCKTMIDLDDLINSVIAAAPATTDMSPVTKFIIEDLQDRMVEVKNGLITIYSLLKPLQTFSFMPNRWANFLSYFQQIDEDAKELNRKTREVNTIIHIGDSYHVSVKSSFLCIDMRRFIVPYGLSHHECRLGRKKIVLRLE